MAAESSYLPPPKPGHARVSGKPGAVHFGLDKYRMLDLEYRLGDLKPPPEERVRAVVDCLGSLGLECEIIA